MGSRFPSHQLSNGLFVSGRPEQPKEKPPPMTSTAVPYTGGDIKKSGELGKMFDIPVLDRSKSIKPGPASSHSGPMTSPLKKSNSGPLNKHGEAIKNDPNSPISKQHSGPLLPATGLITSGPLGSSAPPRKVSGPLDPAGPTKAPRLSVGHNRAVTTLTRDHGTDRHSVMEKIPKPILWLMVLVFGMGFVAGGFILGAVHNPLLLLAVAVIFVIVVTLFAWNSCSGERGVIGFLKSYPDSELRTAQTGQFVKISGVVTCGNVPLESSFQKVPRCVYTATSLYEYRGWGSKPANSSHRLFTWGLRSLEGRVGDFYISDFQSGLRALVKTGYGARVTPYVDDSFVMDVTPESLDRSPDFVRWLESRNVSKDGRTLRLKEGYIKEGSTMSVMGVVERRDNILMIVPPEDGISTGCQWTRCLLPYPLHGIILRAEDAAKNDAIPV